MHASLKRTMKQLNERDIEALRSIYMYRCLNKEQLYHLHYALSLVTQEPITDQTAKKRLKKMTQLGLIEPVTPMSKVINSEPEPVYFLTNNGIQVIRYYFDLPTNVYDNKNHVVKRGYYRASELKIYPKNINHQVYLNQFVLDFIQEHPQTPYKYYDEKHVSQFTDIRPDGMLTIGDTDFFLEMDMATESRKQLQDKWDNYRRFIHSNEFAFKERQIVVLFICGNTEREQERIDLVYRTLFDQVIDVFNKDIDIHVGTHHQLLQLLTTKYIPRIFNQKGQHAQLYPLFRKQGFLISKGEVLKPIASAYYPHYYVQQRQNDVLMKEFVVDDFTDKPVSTFHHLAYFHQFKMYFSRYFNRSIRYIIVGQTEDEIYHYLTIVRLLQGKDIYFTTPERLQRLPFHQALFQFNSLGYRYHFEDDTLQKQIFEDEKSR